MQARAAKRWNKADKDGNAVNPPTCTFIYHFLRGIHARMTQYTRALIAHKVTKPKDLGKLSSQRLKSWGVSKKAHRRAILAQVCWPCVCVCVCVCWGG